VVRVSGTHHTACAGQAGYERESCAHSDPKWSSKNKQQSLFLFIYLIALNVTDIINEDSKYISVPRQTLFTCKVGSLLKICGLPSNEDSKCGVLGYDTKQSDTHLPEYMVS
jgi:hypothetical protein